MRSRAAYTLLFLSILGLAGCGSSARASQAPPLVFPTTASGPSGPPPLSIYVSAHTQQSSTVYALNAQNGGQRWRDQFKTNISYSYLESNVIYFGAADGKVYALDAGSGSTKWTHTIGGFPTVIGVANGVLYVGTTSFSSTGGNAQAGPVYALNTSDGSLKWQSKTTGSIVTQDSDTIYLTTADNQVVALNAGDGSLKWYYRADNIPNIMQIANGQVYLIVGPNQGGQHSSFVVLSASDGSVQWRFPSGSDNTAIGGVAVDNNTVYLEANPATGLFVYSANTVFALNVKDGSQRWQNAIQGAAFDSAYLDSGTLYAASGGGHIYALNTQDGSQRWQATAGNGTGGLAVQAVKNEIAYAASFGDGLYALSTRDGSQRWHYTSDAYVEVFTITNAIYAASIGAQNPSEHGTILSLSIADGSTIWHFDAGTAAIYASIG